MRVTFLHFFLAVCAAQEHTVLQGEDFRNSFNIEVPQGQGQTSLYLCRVPCEPGDVLLQVHGRRIKSGRHILRLDGQVNVVITQVTKQDAGLYRVGVKSSTSEKHIDFQLRVQELCDRSMGGDQTLEYWGPPGSDLRVPCELLVQPRNRKFLCREDCASFLVETNDAKGHGAKYGVEYVSQTSFTAIVRNLRASDAGRYRCGVGREYSYNTCQEFFIRVNGTVQIDPKSGTTGEDCAATVPNVTEECGQQKDATSVALPIVVALLVIIILALVVGLIHVRRKTQSGHNVMSYANATSRAERHSQVTPQPHSCGNVRVYASLRPETRENDYSSLQLQRTNGQTNRDYVQVH